MRNLNQAYSSSSSEEEEDSYPVIPYETSSESSSLSVNLPVMSTSQAIVTFPSDDHLSLINSHNTYQGTNNFPNYQVSPSNINSQVAPISGTATVGISNFYGLHTIQAAGNPQAVSHVLNTSVIRWSTCGSMTLTIILGIILGLGAVLGILLLIFGVIYIASMLISAVVMIAIIWGIICFLKSTAEVALTQRSS